MRDCTSTDLAEPAAGFSTQKFGRFVLGKRNREDTEEKVEGTGQLEISDIKAVEARIKLLLVTIGEKSQSSLERNLELLAHALQDDLTEHGKFILETIFNCVKLIPVKTSIYSTLVGLLNTENEDFGLTVVRRLEEQLVDALTSHDRINIRLLVRFAGCLVLSNAIIVGQFFDVLLGLLGLVDSEQLEGYAADVLVYDVMSVLPWVGEDLYRTQKEAIDAVMKAVRRYMATRKTPASRHLFERFVVLDDEKKTQSIRGGRVVGVV